MTLKNEHELQNSQRKLAELLKLIELKQSSPTTSAAHELSLDSMKKMAQRIRAEIDDYERAGQPR
jgi:hypothetical protein